MDIKTLEALGVTPTALADRIVAQAVEALLSANGFNPDTEEEETYETKFKREISARIQKAVDQKIAALAAEHLIPRVGELIETADMRETTRYGEPKGPALTFKEYIAARAGAYMSEEVDYQGKSKAEADSYNFRSVGPRLVVLMRSYIQNTLDQHAKAAMSGVNKVLAEGMEKAAKQAITSAAAAVKVAVSVENR